MTTTQAEKIREAIRGNLTGDAYDRVMWGVDNKNLKYALTQMGYYLPASVVEACR